MLRRPWAGRARDSSSLAVIASSAIVEPARVAQHRGRATITTGGQRADRGLLASEVISRRPLPGATRLGEMYLDFSSVYSGPSDHPSLMDEIDKAKNWITALRDQLPVTREHDSLRRILNVTSSRQRVRLHDLRASSTVCCNPRT